MSRRLTKEELDEQFEQFLKESVSDDSVDLGSAKRPSVLDSLGKAVKEPVETTAASQPWCSEDSEDSVGRGLSLSGKTFRKPLRKSQPIKEEDDDMAKHRHCEEQEKQDEEEEQGAESALFCRDSLEPEESVMASGPGLNFTGFGSNTLDEEEEKAQFFANLERGASSTIDYSRLNRELDSTGSTLATTLRYSLYEIFHSMCSICLIMYDVPSRMDAVFVSDLPTAEELMQPIRPELGFSHLEEARRKRRWSLGESLDPITEEKLQLIEKEVKEQETIIQGYQQENEKLYRQVKALQAQSKASEEAMFKENQRLQTELATCREEVSRNIGQQVVGNVLEPDHSQALSVLLAQVKAAQKNEVRLMEEIRRLKQEKQALEVDLEVMKKERDLAKAQANHTSGEKSFAIKMLEERHKEELLALNKKLQWYAENQELLDRDAARLRAATDEAQRLKEQVEKLKSEIKNKNGQQQNKVKMRIGDAKRILDLERQVKEMEEILRRRHPNSLPSLMLAAAAAEPVTPECAGTVAFLERRVQRLEAELEGRDEEAKRSLRAMEQQYHKIKIQYEQQISQLEQQLAMKAERTQAVSPQAWESKAQSLEKELLHLQETQRNREDELLAEITALQGQLQQARCKEKPQKSPSRHERQAEEAQGVRIDRMTQELTAKSKTIQELTRVVERLQKERRSLLLAPPLQGRNGDTKKQGVAVAETFPPTLDEKNYQPSEFSGSHISEVLQENEQLRARLEQVELEAEHERVTLQAATAQAEGELRRVQESLAEQLSSLRTKHQRELENILTRHALEHSSSKVAELTNQLHLRDQVKELQGCKEALVVSQVREETLQNEMSKLLEELKEAKEQHSPTLKHFTALEKKIKNMELRHMQRERELQQVITRTWLATDEEQHQNEVEAWRRLAQAKTQELEAFRVELDSILEVLRELQRQNVVLPAPGTAHTATFAQKS
uniref:Centrosomal protein of 162 kDa n=1 Tax=Scleropages formosus TaxID=113540 RepID=A0A8C9U578_SCLFO